MSTTPAGLTQSPNRLLAEVVGIILVLLGLFGFFVATDLPFATPQGAVFLGLFASNGLLATLHVVAGAVLVLCGLIGPRSSKIFGSIVGLGLVVIALFGFFADHTAGNIVAVNIADNIVHLIFGALLLAAGLTSDRLFRTPAVA